MFVKIMENSAIPSFGLIGIILKNNTFIRTVVFIQKLQPDICVNRNYFIIIKTWPNSATIYVLAQVNVIYNFQIFTSNLYYE